MQEAQIKVQDILLILKKKWMILAVISLLVTTIVAVFNYFIVVPKYSASTKLFIGQESKDGTYSTDIEMYQKLLKTYSEIILTNDLIDTALKSKNIEMSPEAVMGGLSVVPSSNTQILFIQYESDNKVLAKDIVDGITEEFIKESEEYMPNCIIKVMEHVQLPKQPIGSEKMKNIIVGFAAGLLMGVILLVCLEYIDDTFKSKSEFERITGIDVIGVINSENQE